MKKLLFILFFPITIPLYLIYRFFGWLSDTFIPFVQYDVIPFLSDTLLPAIKKFINYIKEKSAERKGIKEKAESATVYSAETQIINIPAGNYSDIQSKCDSNEMTAESDFCGPADTEFSQMPDFSKFIELDNNSNLDPYFIKALAIAAYNDTVSLSSFQFELGISSRRANVLLCQLIENEIVSKTNSDFIYDTYKSNLSKQCFNEWYKRFSLEYKKQRCDEIKEKISSQKSTNALSDNSSQITIFDDIIITVTDTDKYDWLFKLSNNENDYSLNDKVYLMFCWLGSSKNNLKRCTTPEKFFENLISTITILKKLSKLEELKKYAFYKPSPSEQLREVLCIKNYTDLINDFIERYWFKICQEADRYKTDEKRYEKINSFKSSLAVFNKYFLQENNDYIKQLSESNIDIHNLPKSQKEVKPFDKNTEKMLLKQLKYAQNALDRHFCYNELIDFYYKYRNDYPEAVQQCLQYCIKDIDSFQETNDEYQQERIRNIKFLYRNEPDKLLKELDLVQNQKNYFHVHTFDRITMLLFYEKDYDQAISYCKLAIENEQDVYSKFTKRMERLKKKCVK